MIEDKKIILLFQRIIPAYRLAIFQKLHHHLNIITCYSEANRSSSLQSVADKPDFPVIKLPRFFYRNSPTAVIQNPLPVLLRYRPGIIICESSPSYLTLWLLILLKPIFGYKLVLWGHGVKYNEMDTPFNTRRSKILLRLFNLADAVLVYSGRRAQKVKERINNPRKVFIAWNTLDTEELERIHAELTKEGKDCVKKSLGFTSRFNLIYIGRLLNNKGIIDLVEAFHSLPDELDVSLHIIGEGPQKQYIKKLSSVNEKIKVYGSIFNPILTGKMLFASDLMVIPGDVGLSVVHSFAFGCPLITYKSKRITGPRHGPEVEYIKPGVNGLFVENSTKSLAKEMETLLKSPDRLEKMAENALNTARNEASFSHMLQGFAEIIAYLENTRSKDEN